MYINHPTSKFGRNILLSILILPLIIFLCGAFFVRYVADDFCHFNTVHSIGVFNFVVQFYESWTGSWAFVFGLGISKFLPIWLTAFSVLLAWIIVLIGLTRRWNPLLGLALLVTTFATNPDPVSTLYIQAGLLKYEAPLVALCLEAWLLVALPETVWTWALCGLTAIVAAALGDLSSIAQIIILPSLLMLFPKYRKRLVFTLLAAIIGFLIVYLAPGTAGRQSAFARPDLILSIIMGARATGYPIAQAMRLSPLAFVAMMVIAFLGGQNIVYSEIDRQKIKLQIVVILATIIVLNFVCQLAAYYTTSAPLPDRAQFIPIFLSLAGFMWTAYLLGSLFKWKSPTILMVSVVLLTVTGLASAFGTVSVMQYLDTAWDTRDHLMRTTGELTRLDVPLDIWDIENPGIRSCIIAYYRQPDGQ